MTSPAALVLHPDPGGTMRLAQPIPAVAVLTLPMLVSAHTREWVIVLGADSLEVADHLFTVEGWDRQDPPGLIVEHVCCRTVDEWHR